MGKDFELRLVSLVVRARELANEVSVIDLGSTDDTVNMAEKVDCEVITHTGDILVPTLARFTLAKQQRRMYFIDTRDKALQTTRYAPTCKQSKRKLGRAYVIYH